MNDLHLEESGICQCTNAMRKLAALTICDGDPPKEAVVDWLLTLGLATRTSDDEPRLVPLGDDEGVTWSPKDRLPQLAGRATIGRSAM